MLTAAGTERIFFSRAIHAANGLVAPRKSHTHP